MTDSEDQEDEILAVSEILPPGSFRYQKNKDSLYVGHIEINVDLTNSMTVIESPDSSFTVKYLPPIQLMFTLPANYPSIKPPEPSINCVWLTMKQIQILRQSLIDLAQEYLGNVVLFLWINLLQQESLEILELGNEIDLHVIRADKSAGSESKESSKKAPLEEQNNLNPGAKEFTPLSPPTKVSTNNDKDTQNKSDKNSEKTNEEQSRKKMSNGRESRKSAKDSKVRQVGKVRSWNLNTCSGLIHSYSLGEVIAHMNDIAKPNFARLEVSLNVGEKVEFEVASPRKGEKKPRAVNISAPSFQVVQGSKQSEPVKILEKDVIGRVESWSRRNREGSIIVEDGNSSRSIYVYYTSLHFEEKLMKQKDTKLVFNIVNCEKFGTLAQFVRICSDHSLSEKNKHVMSSTKHCDSSDAIPTSHHGFWDINKVSNAVEKTTISATAENPSDQDTVTNDKDLDNTAIGRNDSAEGKSKDGKTAAIAMSEEDRIQAGVQFLATRLKEFNTMKEEKMFNSTMFTCLVCFSERSGGNCVKFPACSHVYCKECMAQYFKVQIETGQVKNLTCPSDQCKSQALPSQVEELVDAKLYAKYENLLLDTTLQAMADVVACPRIFCQCPTMIDRESNLGQCPSCLFSFCIYCLATYHGVSPCKMKTKEHREICNKYSEGTEEDKAFLEKRYGRSKLQQLMDNVKSEDYLTENARTCPHCSAPIEKNDGCNKMTCWRCRTNFCWLCGEKLSAQNPYSHFNVMGNNCYGALFQGIDPDIDDEWVNFFL